MALTFSRLSLRRLGFDGFMTVAELRAEKCRSVPELDVRGWLGGVYIACREPSLPLAFKRQNRREAWTLPPSVLRDRWVAGSPIVYIGKADATEAGNNLKTRVSRYLRAATSHSGGKRTWQLAGWDELVIAWQILPPTETPLAVETALLTEHVRVFGRPPFANG